MPTGYTHPVQNGTITEFDQFAFSCARAFGALILMRDDPADAPIPERFEPSDYHTKAIEKSRAELLRLEAMTPAEAGAAASAERDKERKAWEERRDRRDVDRLRYEAMLAKVRAWHPPSVDHVKFKEFMESQLTESISFDCSHTYDDPPKYADGREWRKKRITAERDNIDYHKREYQKEVERTEERNRWIQQLRDSLQTTTSV